MENPQMHAYTLPWSEYALDDLFSSSNIESREKKKKIYIPLNYWGFYFERRMWLWVWMCGGKGMAIRCGNHETKNVCPYPYSLSLSFDCFSLFFSFLWKVYWIHRYNKKKREKLTRNSCRHIHQAFFSDAYHESVVTLLCKLLQTSEMFCIFRIGWFLLPIHVRLWNNRRRYHNGKLWIALDKALKNLWKKSVLGEVVFIKTNAGF